LAQRGFWTFGAPSALTRGTANPEVVHCPSGPPRKVRTAVGRQIFPADPAERAPRLSLVTSLRKGLVMSSRIIVSLAASVIVSIVCLATISTDAFAYRRGVGVGRVGGYHGGVYRGGVYRGAAVRRGVAVGVGAAAVGATAAGAYGAYRCGYYHNQPCY
jgi:hypothetical protein